MARDTARSLAAEQGRNAEDLALKYLLQHGLTLIERNFRCRLGEIDLVMAAAGLLVIAEVRYRSPGRFGSGFDSVGHHKKKRLVRAAAMFLARNPCYADHCMRFDVIAVERTPGGECKLQWTRDAFRP